MGSCNGLEDLYDYILGLHRAVLGVYRLEELITGF